MIPNSGSENRNRSKPRMRLDHIDWKGDWHFTEVKNPLINSPGQLKGEVVYGDR